MSNRVNEIEQQRKLIEGQNKYDRKSYKYCLEQAVELEKKASAWREMARRHDEQISKNTDKFYELGNELEQLTKTKRVTN